MRSFFVTILLFSCFFFHFVDPLPRHVSWASVCVRDSTPRFHKVNWFIFWLYSFFYYCYYFYLFIIIFIIIYFLLFGRDLFLSVLTLKPEYYVMRNWIARNRRTYECYFYYYYFFCVFLYGFYDVLYYIGREHLFQFEYEIRRCGTDVDDNNNNNYRTN